MWLSPSQINTFRQCQRKWGWRKLDGIEVPSNAAAQQGKHGHSLLEKYLTTASIDMSDSMADLVVTGLHHYPLPCTPGMQVEHHFGVMIGGYLFHGYKDVQLLKKPWKEQGCVGCSGLPSGTLCPNCIPQIWDHKFTSNINGHWVLTDTSLALDTQAVIYALDAMLATNQKVVRCNWVYYQRRGARRNKKVQALLKLSDIFEPLRDIVTTAREIHAVRAKYTSARRLPPNVEQCGRYGGCPYQPYCKLSPSEIFTSTLHSSAAQRIFQGKE